MKFKTALQYLESGHKIRRTSFTVAEYLERQDSSRTVYIKNRNEDSPMPTEKLSFNAILADDWQVLIDGNWLSEMPEEVQNTETDCVSVIIEEVCTNTNDEDAASELVEELVESGIIVKAETINIYVG